MIQTGSRVNRLSVLHWCFAEPLTHTHTKSKRNVPQLESVVIKTKRQKQKEAPLKENRWNSEAVSGTDKA